MLKYFEIFIYITYIQNYTQFIYISKIMIILLIIHCRNTLTHK